MGDGCWFCFQFESASKAGCTPTSVPKHKHMSSLSRLKRSFKRNKVSRAGVRATAAVRCVRVYSDHSAGSTPQENATPKISGHQIQLMKPCFKKGSLVSVSL